MVRKTGSFKWTRRRKQNALFACGFVVLYGALSLYLYSKGLEFLAAVGLLALVAQYLSVKAKRLEWTGDMFEYEDHRDYRKKLRRREKEEEQQHGE